MTLAGYLLWVVLIHCWMPRLLAGGLLLILIVTKTAKLDDNLDQTQH